MTHSTRSPRNYHFRRWTEAALSLVFPPACALCDESLDVSEIHPQLCQTCTQQIFTPRKMGCPRCGAFGMQVDHGLGNCMECRDKKLSFDQVISLGEYAGRLRAAVVQMKYEGGQSLASAVGRRLGELAGCVNNSGQADLLTCIPKYWIKRLLTGVNSAETIMSGLGKQAQLDRLNDLLICRRRIGKQSLLSPDQRRRNVRGAWMVSSNYDLTDMHIMLVDDIMTTGATANEAARALKAAGANRVSVAVVGRATKLQ